MSTPEKFKIACYMAWCGAEATFPFSRRVDYEKRKLLWRSWLWDALVRTSCRHVMPT